MLNIVKNTTIFSPFDLLAPHSCRCCGKLGDVLCERCKKYLNFEHENYCPNCKTLNPTGKCQNCKNLPPIFVVGERSSLIGNLIHDYKYNSTRALKKPLAELLDETLPFIDGKVSIIPLPTINRHIRERGLDHTYKITKELAKLRGKNYEVERLLLRSNHAVQVGATEQKRKEQAKTAYSLNNNLIIDPETTYLLFDDVWTTGSSMKSALEILKKTRATKIIISVLAVNSLDKIKR